MSGGVGILAVTGVIGYIIYLQILCIHARNITLLEPQSIIRAQLGEELQITCLGTKCQNPDFNWASLTDSPLSGTINYTGRVSVLTMKISHENLDLYDSYRCTVRCDNPPAEKGFKVIVYSFPQPILDISSLTAGEPSRVTCTIPEAYPFYMFNARVLIGEEVVATYEDPEVKDYIYVVKNITISHDLILTEEYEAREIRCEAELQFLEDGIDPINKNTLVHLNLQYPPGKPAITVVPDRNINAAEDISLSCPFESRSPARVQWFKLDEGKEVVMTSNDQGVLTIVNAVPEDSGVYICRVENHVGMTSSQVEITVQGLPEKPTLSFHPARVVQIGQSVTINCSANGNTNVNLALRKVYQDGDVYIQEGGDTLTIDEAGHHDTGVYKCTAENQYGASEESGSLTVEYPPIEVVFTSSDEKVIEGGEVTLKCASNGVPRPSFFIYHLLPSGDGVLVTEGPMVTLTNVKSGIYECEARNSLGATKAKLDLRARYAPRDTFLSITPSAGIREGRGVHMRCTSEAYPAPRLVLKKKTSKGVIELEAENGQLSISHIGEEHEGRYICESSNVVGRQEVEVTLIVQVPPKNTHIAITPSGEAREGDFIHITCTSEASPAPSLSLKVRTEHGVRELASEGGQYQIEHVTTEHGGTYICESINVAGEEQAEATLTIQVPPKNTHIAISPSGKVKEGDLIDITCTSEASPAPRLALKLKTENGVRDLISEGGRYQIAHAALKHEGTYICESTNIAGQEEVEATLTIQVPPKNTRLTISPSTLLKEGESGFILCTSEATPAPRLVLKKQTEEGPTDLDMEDGDYLITNAGEEDAGSYICEATNEAGHQVAEITVIVHGAPRNTYISMTPSSVVIVGDDVQIRCVSEAYPPPVLVLMVKTEHGYIRRLESEDGLYNITKAGEENIGTYICEATNVVGQQTAETLLNVQIPRSTTVVTPSENVTAGGNDTIIYDTHTYMPPAPQRMPKGYVPVAIIGSIVLLTAGFVGLFARHLQQARVQGSYSLVKALRSKV